MHTARQAATKERFKPDLPKRLAALREKGSLKISFRPVPTQVPSTWPCVLTLVETAFHPDMTIGPWAIGSIQPLLMACAIP